MQVQHAARGDTHKAVLGCSLAARLSMLPTQTSHYGHSAPEACGAVLRALPRRNPGAKGNTSLHPHLTPLATMLTSCFLWLGKMKATALTLKVIKMATKTQTMTNI